MNFVSGGQVGDLLHELYVVKRICLLQNVKANLYIVDNSYNNYIYGCGDFTFDLNKTLNDLISLISFEKHINKIDILPKDFNEEFINLNLWRKAGDVSDWKSWTYLLNQYFNINFDFNENYKFLDGGIIDERGLNKIIIHHSDKRNNNLFNWSKILDVNDDIIFVTSNINEYNIFPYKNSKIKLLCASNIAEFASIIKGCKLFVGNQSMPLALASALDVPRIAILYHNSSMFYMNEHSYSKNISWFLSNDIKYNSKNIGIQI